MSFVRGAIISFTFKNLAGSREKALKINYVFQERFKSYVRR